jgi:hypothetical protein
MGKQTGTILKIKNNNAIVMTRDCRIISIKTQPGMYVGLEINFGKNEIIRPGNKKIVCSGLAAGITVLFLFFFTLLNLSDENRIFAYVDIDFNKSLELAVDKDNKVVKVFSYDHETQDLINELNLKSKSVDTAIKEVMSKADKNENMILISACLKNTDNLGTDKANKKEYEKFEKLLKVCKNAVEDQSNRTIESKVVAVNYKYKELANAKEISMGRCFLYEKAKQQGVDINIEEIKTKSISDTLKKVKIDDTGIIHENNKDLSLPKPEDKKLRDASPTKLTDSRQYPIYSATPENKLLEPHEGEKSMPPLPQEHKGKPGDLNPSHEIKTAELKENPHKPTMGDKTTPPPPIEPAMGNKITPPPPIGPTMGIKTTPPPPIGPTIVDAAPLPASIATKDKQLPSSHTHDEPKIDKVNPPPTPDAIKNKPEPIPPTPVENKKSEVNSPPTPEAKKNELVPPSPVNGPVPPPPTPDRS